MEGEVGKWLSRMFGASWKTTLLGFIAGSVMIVAAYKPEWFPGGVQAFINGISLILFGGLVRENKINDAQAGVNHETQIK